MAPDPSRPKNTYVREDKLLPHLPALHLLLTSPATRARRRTRAGTDVTGAASPDEVIAYLCENEITQPPGRFHRWTLLCPRVTLAGSASSVSVRCRFHTWRPVYRGFSRIVVTVPSVQPAPVRCVLRPGSAADGHGTAASFKARAIRATECPARRWAKIHRTTCAVRGSGSRRCARRPHAACALFGCGPASASRYP